MSLKQSYYISIPLLFCLLMSGDLAAQGAGRDQVTEGNRLYKDGKYDEANNLYRDAQLDNPESPIILFNIGNVLYKKRKYEDALEAFRKTVQKSDDVNLQAQGYYNIANTLYRLDKWQESALAYQQALKLNPDDTDTKFNLEYVRTKMKQNSEKKDQQNDKKTTPSEYAKRLKEQADAFIDKQNYNAAHQLMMKGMQEDKTVTAYQNFIQKIKDVIDIEAI